MNLQWSGGGGGGAQRGGHFSGLVVRSNQSGRQTPSAVSRMTRIVATHKMEQRGSELRTTAKKNFDTTCQRWGRGQNRLTASLENKLRIRKENNRKKSNDEKKKKKQK